jgi:HEAT repeat protein
VAFSAATIATTLSAHALHAVPSGLAATVAATAALKGTAATASTATLLKTTLKLMAWTKAKTTAVAVVGVLLAAGTTTVIVKKAYPSEPDYQGRTLSDWLASLGRNQLQFLNLRPQPNQPAAEAFQAMGARAVPFLHRELRSLELARREHAADAAHAIGPGAKQLIPDLLASAISTANSGQDPYSEVFALAAMGPESIGPLTNMFTNQNRWARIRTGDAFYMTDYDAEPAVPALLIALEDADPGVRSEAAQALGHVHKRLDAVLPALLKNLKDPDASVRLGTADALGLLGPDAKSAVPALLEVWRSDPDRTVSPFAAFALKKIDPEAAAKAGVK